MLNVDNSRKGIYKDLYRTLEADKHNHKKKNETFSARVPKGIYKDIYREIGKAAGTDNIWHKYPLKALVYSNDAGEALRPIIGGFMARLSWIPAILYTLFAVHTKGDKETRKRELIFQAIASFALPFLLLKSTAKLAHKGIDKISPVIKQKIKTAVSSLGGAEKIINKFKKRNASGYRNLAVSSLCAVSVGVGAKPIDNMVKSYMEL